MLYREENDVTPLNVILIRQSKISDDGESEFRISNQYRTYEFKTENEVLNLYSISNSYSEGSPELVGLLRGSRLFILYMTLFHLD